jgi:hypothetical protein
MKTGFMAHGLLLVLLLSMHSALFAAYGAVAELPKIELNRGGIIKAMVELPDGSVVIGGQFSLINGKAQVALAKLKADGTLDEDWNTHIRGGTYPEVNALALAGNDLYIGGNFYEVDGKQRRGIASIDVATGQVNPDWNPWIDGDSSNPTIYSLQLSANGEQLFAGGYLSRLGGRDINAIAKISTLTAEVDPDWNPQINSSGYVFVMLLTGDDLYIGGQFTEIAGVARRALAKVSAIGTGTLDTQWNPNLVNGRVHSLAISDTGDTLYIGGDFSKVGGLDRAGLARVSATGTGAVDTWDAGASIPATTKSLLLTGDGLYVGGLFSNIGGQPRNSIARLSTTDATADSWNPDAGMGSDSRDVAVYSILLSADDSKMYLGGSFVTMGSKDALSFAIIDKSSATPAAGFNDMNIGNPGEIYAVATQGDAVYFAGNFVRANGKSLHYLGKWDSANNTLVDWDGDFDDRVLAVSLSSDGNSVYAGGYFTHASGLERNHLAKLATADAGIDATWDPNVDYVVETLLVNNNDLYIGGWFHRIGGVTRQRLARLAADTGSVDTTWNPDPDNTVFALALSGTNLYVGGYFSSIGGQTRNKLAKIDTGTGNADPAWQADADSSVKSLAISSSALFAAGYFKNIGGQARNSMAKLSITDGSIDSWDLALNSHARIETLALSSDGADLYLGGRSFQMGGSGDYRSLAKVAAADGTRDNEWDPETLYNKEVLALTATDSGIYAGGKFSEIGGKTTALAHIVDGHLLTLAMTATNTDAYKGRVISEPEGLVCEPHSTALQECKRAFTPGAVTLKTASSDPNITLSQEWLSGCAAGGGTTSSCTLPLDADRTVEMTISCESYDVPTPDQPITTFRNISCNNIKVVHGFETGDGGKTTFTATQSVELGPGFRVSDAPGFFSIRMQ